MAGVLEGKSAVVTGGGGGFGRASARVLIRDGAAVTLQGRTESKLEKARDMLLGEYPDAKIAIQAGDSTDEKDVAAAVDTAIALGGGIDIFVSVVGGGRGFGPISDVSYEDFLYDYKVNTGSAFLAVKYAAPKMRRGGSFVFISSTAAISPFINLAPYCAAKAGLDHFVRTVASEMGPKGLRFNCVRPGVTRTDATEAGLMKNQAMIDKFIRLTPLGRTGEAMEVAEAVRYFAGPESGWTTGQSIAVDGGNELRGMPLPD